MQNCITINAYELQILFFFVEILISLFGKPNLSLRQFHIFWCTFIIIIIIIIIT
jgi:hypothetical protein